MATTLPRLLRKTAMSFKKIGNFQSFKKHDLYSKRLQWRVHGVSHSFADDFQYVCLMLDWFRLWAVVLGVYCGFALVFAALTSRLVMDSEDHFTGDVLQTMSLLEQCFWLSVGHLISIGYGHLLPVSCLAHILVTVQFFLGILLSALLLGVVVTKASLPSVKLGFSSRCVVTSRNDIRHFMFRVANTRGNLLVAPDIRLSCFSHVETTEGESIWVAIPLEVTQPPVMAPSFNVVHKIDETSPLYNFSNEELKEKDYSVSLVATDSHTFQTLYAAKYYQGRSDLFTGVRFANILKRQGNTRIVDFTKLDDVEPIRQRPADSDNAGDKK